ncbi:hypothetical protein [Methylorubrum populi]|uniref:hypothetical protein n=1 Tax=Methylorubrum populi TaxID=223967 RepID=UPI000DB815C8|nr:hypothetical protein [Methylorubrum populi]PZP71731.1 MAG: hypothetical protein DI590_05570 [Methylorubrum populi]
MNQHLDPSTVVAAERRFRIDWRIDIDASSPREAAFFAREIQEQPENTATVYSVEDKQTGEIHVIDTALDDAKGQNQAARRPEDTTYTARSLRLDRPLQTRDGQSVEVIEQDNQVVLGFPIRVRAGGRIDFYVTKAGRRFLDREDALDVVEVNPATEKWVRLYDRKLNAAGKQVVGGKEFAAERGLFMYVFDTEEQARASLQGVRAVFPIRYREGEGLG